MFQHRSQLYTSKAFLSKVLLTFPHLSKSFDLLIRAPRVGRRLESLGVSRARLRKHLSSLDSVLISKELLLCMCGFTMRGGLTKLILNMQSRQIFVQFQTESLYYFSAEWIAWKQTEIPSLRDYRFHLHQWSQSQLHTSLLACVKWRWANFSLVKGVYCRSVCHSVLQLMQKTINWQLKQRVT